jgi:hypothetical protein
MRKRLMVQVLVLVGIFSVAGLAHALPSTVNLKFTGVSPSSSGKVIFPDFNDQTFGSVNAVYGQYNFDIDYDGDGYYDGSIGGYCVENVYAPPKNQPYEYAVLSVYNDEPYENYLSAAYLWENSDGLSEQARQLLVWETVFDGLNTDLTDGEFKVDHNNAYVAEALSFIGDASFWNGLNDFTGSGYYILRNPPISAAGTPKQDYLVRSVPDASVMFLLGPALIGLGIWGRRKN